MSRPPPARTRKHYFIKELEEMADSDINGYSQRPPSGRWGPDFDCASLIYYAANKAGYPVGTGSDKVRFTGTMLKDFEKAGFQILPFANVGISDLKIGDILLNLALHAEVYVGEGQTIAATGSENGTLSGRAGDQTGHEIERHPVTTFTKGWDYILRPPEDDEIIGNDEELEEGDEEVPMNYGPTQMGPQTPGYNNMGMPWGSNAGYSPNYYGYPNQMPQQGGNLGQMNGYSQAGNQYRNQMNPNMVPQQGGPTGDLKFVMGIEGAKNCQGAPNTRDVVFDEDKPLMYILHFGQNCMVDDLRVYEFTECSEEMPQHLSPLMQNTPMGNSQMNMGEMVTKNDVMQMIQEAMNNESSQNTGQPSQTRNSQQHNSNGQSRNGSRTN